MSNMLETIGRHKVEKYVEFMCLILVGPKQLAPLSVSQKQTEFYDGGLLMIFGNLEILKHKLFGKSEILKR